jgi:hypothetical protein
VEICSDGNGYNIEISTKGKVIEIREKTPADTFKNCIRVEENSGTDLDYKCYRTYVPDVGLIQDGDLLLTEYNIPTQ